MPEVETIAMFEGMIKYYLEKIMHSSKIPSQVMFLGKTLIISWWKAPCNGEKEVREAI